MLEGQTDATATDEVVEIPEVEVDAFTDAVDENDATYNEEGTLIGVLDREKNQRLVLKGHGTKAPVVVADADAVVETDAVDPDKVADEDADEVEYINQADYILKRTGYKNEDVDMGDGQMVKIADLTHEQQLSIVTTEFENTVDALEAKVAELEARAPELKFEDPLAQQLVDYLKEGGDIKKLAKEILTRDPAAQAKMMSDDDINKAGIRKQFPEYTDAEVEEEFSEMSVAAKARRAKVLRTKMETEKPDFTNLTKEQKEANDKAVLEVEKVFTAESNKVREAAKKITKIAGIPISDGVRNFLVNHTLPVKSSEDSTFIKDLANNPDELLLTSFWRKYGEDLVAKTKTFYHKQGFTEGLAEGNKGKDKLSDGPVKVYGTGKVVEKKAPVLIDESNIEAWLNGSNEF